MNGSERTTMIILSAVIILGFGGVLIMWFVWPPDEKDRTILAALATALCTGYLQVVNYWFPIGGRKP